MNPADFRWEERENIIDWAERIFLNEICALEDAESSGHTPRIIGSIFGQQSSEMPYPEGYLHLILMSFVPGENPAKIYNNLTTNDLWIIRTQLAQTLE